MVSPQKRAERPLLMWIAAIMVKNIRHIGEELRDMHWSTYR